MSSKQLRIVMRWGHIVGGSIVAAFVYSGTLRGFDAFVLATQVVVIPALIISGIVMWQLPLINKLLKQAGLKRDPRAEANEAAH
ncbi:MAG: hypothetical protein GYB68_09535 [Chloroflexi bacterium]|nr:hypothetical protein [Chloroflexota bacterium]